MPYNSTMKKKPKKKKVITDAEIRKAQKASAGEAAKERARMNKREADKRKKK